MSLMPQLSLYDTAGQKVGQVEGADEIFAAKMNRDLLHQAVLVIDGQRQLKGGHTQNRGDVNRTTAKMFRQKGLGRARHGSRSAMQFVGGAVAHGPHGDNRIPTMPKRARRAALYAALSDKARRGKVLVMQELALEAPRTKDVVALLAAMHVQGKVIMLVTRDEATHEANFKSVRNIPGLVLRESPHLNAREALWADYVILTEGGLQCLSGPRPDEGGDADA
jgi:large subunit ribosomal protein L4